MNEPLFELPKSGPGAIRAGVDQTLEALVQDKLLTDHHAATCAIARELADAVDRGLRSPRGASVATATLSKHLLEAIDSLPKPTTVDDSLTALLAQMNQAVRA